jgi:hypothetical protein
VTKVSQAIDRLGKGKRFVRRWLSRRMNSAAIMHLFKALMK